MNIVPADLSLLLEDISKMGDIRRGFKVSPPNQDVISDTSKICKKIWETKGMLPSSIFPSYMEGIYFDYILDTSHRVVVEVYNVGDAVVIATNDAKVIDIVEIPILGRVRVTCFVLNRFLRRG